MFDVRIEECPHCGNKVQGIVRSTFARKITRGTIKKGSTIATGAFIGSVVPGVGTLVGAGLGVVAGAVMEDKVKKFSDLTEDILFDNATFKFTCPNCRASWTREYNYKDDDFIPLSSCNNNDVVRAGGKSKSSNNVCRDEKVEGITGMAAADIVIQVVSQVTGALKHVIIPNTDLEEELGADDETKKKILVALEKKFGVNISKEPDDFTYVDDFIEEITGESFWLEDDDEEENYDSEAGRFSSFFQSYLDDKYQDKEYTDVIDMFVREAERCEDEVVKSQYYCVASVIGLETFLKEWLTNNFKNYPEDELQNELQKYCLTNCIKYIGRAKREFPDNAEYNLILGTLLVCEKFWVESYTDKSFYEGLRDYTYGLVGDGEGDVFNIEWLNKLFGFAYNNVIALCNDSENESDTDNNAEQEYLKELEDILSDGEISQRERRLLDKIRTQLGISEERAAELEASLSKPSLTQEEQEYLDEYKEIIADGEISPRDQRFLDKLKKANGISESRAKEIEALA